MSDIMMSRWVVRYLLIAIFVGRALAGDAAEATVVANFTFSPSSPTVGQQIQFTDTSTGNPTNWQWDFDNDGSTDSTAQNPTHTFNSPGTYPVKLIALIPPADIDEIVKNVVVAPIDPDDHGDLSFTMSTYSFNEGVGTASIAVERTDGTDGSVSVRCDSSNGSATAGSDYTATMDTLNWANGSGGIRNCTVPINDDSLDETNENFTLSLTNATGGATIISPSSATVTIVDNDGDPGDLSFTSSSYQVDEDDGTASISVRRTSGSFGTVTVRCNTSGGTATAGIDYTTTMDTLTWTNGDTANKTCTVPILDDGINEPDETVGLSLTNFTGGADMGSPTTATLTINDDDPIPPTGVLSFTMSSYSVNEGGTASITVERTSGSSGAASVRCDTVAGGTANAGSDYTTTMQTLNWADGDATNKTCTVPTTNDNNEEGNETVSLALTNFVGAGPGSPTTATLLILDNDEAGVLSFTMSGYSVEEDIGIASIPVRRTGGSDGAVSVRCDTVAGGTATAGSDYTVTMDTLNWAHGDTTNKNCTIPITNDATPEFGETISLMLTNPTNGAGLGTPATATLTILKNDMSDPGDLSFTLATYNVSEDLSVASIPVRRTGGSDGMVTVRCDTSNGTATAPDDYTATMDTLTWIDGDTANKNCTIPIIDDTDVEGNETVNLTLTNFTGGAGSGTPASAVMTIIDDDRPGDLSFTMESYQVNEDGTTASIAVQRTVGSDGAVSVRCDTANGTATAPGDYTTTMDTLNWGDEDTADKFCTVPIINDVNVEGNETVLLSLTNFGGGATEGDLIAATLTIIDDEVPGDLSFTMSTYQVNEDAGTASIAVQRTGGSDGAVSVRCDTANGTATAPDDYTATMDTLSWTDGDITNKLCTVPINNDPDVEGSETVLLSLTNFTGMATPGNPTNATLTILDDEVPGELSFTMSTYQVNEDGGTATVPVERADGSNGAVSVNCNTVFGGTATAGSDYVSTNDTLNWNDGESGTKDCTIPILDDTNIEGSETVQLSLTNFTGGADPGDLTAATLTIIDDDVFADDFESANPAAWSSAVGNGPHVSFRMKSYTVDEGGTTASIAVRRTGLPVTGAISVRCDTSNGTATAGSDYTAQMDTLNWIANDTTDKFCTIPVTDDFDGEIGETINLALTNVTGAALGLSHAVLTINDNENAELSFTAASYSVPEIDTRGIASLAVRRTGVASGAVSVDCSTTGGTAAAGVDYVAVAEETLNWGTGDTDDKSCDVDVIDDPNEEGNETVDLLLTNFTGGADPGNITSAELTILDDDEAGALSFSMASYSVDEGVGIASIAVTRTGGMDGLVSVQCNTSDATATAGSDYTATMDVLMWADGDTTNKQCTIPINDDAANEDDESLSLSLTNFTNGVSGGTHTNAAVTIEDNERGALSFTVSSLSVDEGVGTATIDVQRVGGNDGLVTVRCDTSDGTATASDDYTAQMDTLTWPDGVTTNQQCTIPINEDSNDESDETVLLALTNVTGGATIVAPSSATLTIEDNERGALSFTVSSLSVDEGVGTATIDVQRVGGNDGLVTVRCDTSDGTATAGDDYTAQMDTLTWPDGVTTNQQCTIPINEDSNDESDETVLLALTNVTGGATIVAPSSATLTIEDNERGALSFTVSSLSVDEGVGTATIDVQRVGGNDGLVTVRCDTSDGTATAGDDYTAQMDTLTWPDGVTTNQQCTIPINEDSNDESDETVLLALTNVTGGATIAMPSAATLTITDNDEAGDLSFTMSSYTVSEGVGTATIDVQRTGGSDGLVTVRCDTADGTATAGDDYTAQMDTLTWPDGDITHQQCTIPINDDSNDEGDETVMLSLTNVTGGATIVAPSTATLTITDNDEAGDLSFTMSTYTVIEGVGTATIDVRRTGGSDGSVTVRCDTADGTATAGDDYTAQMDTLTWPDGNTTNQQCTIPITDDPDDESDETVMLTLTNVTGGATIVAPSTATLTITDNDEAGDLSFTMSTYKVGEGDTSAMIEVERTGGSDGTVTVRCDTSDGTATAGSDYTATMETLSWTNGDSANKSCTIPITDDSDDETDETVTLSLTNVTGGATTVAPNTATLTIEDNEAKKVSFTMSTFTVDEGVAGGNATVEVRRTGTNNGVVSVDCNTADNTATAGSDYTATMATLSWVAGESGTKECIIPINDDSDGESDETIALSLSNFTGGAIAGTPSTATLTIKDDEPAELSFTMGAYTVDETVGSAIIPIQRTGDTAGVASVRCDTTDGTAVAPGDYTATMDTLSWVDDESGTKDCTIPIILDMSAELAETVNLSLSNVSGASLGTPNTATLTINANATRAQSDTGSLSFAESNYQVDEDGRVALITIQRTGGSEGAVSVQCETSEGTATEDSDYSATIETLEWEDGETGSKTCMLPILADVEFEDTETMTLLLTNAVGADLGTPATATLTIVDSEQEIFSEDFESGSTSAWSSATGITAPSPESSTGIELNVLGDDRLECGPIQLAPAVETGSIRLRALAAETFHLKLSTGETIMLDRDTPVRAGEVIEITGLPLATYELGITTEDRSLANFAIELTAVAPCALFEIDP